MKPPNDTRSLVERIHELKRENTRLRNLGANKDAIINQLHTQIGYMKKEIERMK